MKEQKAREYALNMYKAEFGYDKFDIQDAYGDGWDAALKSQWVSIEERLPEIGEKVLVLTANKRIVISFRYIPKDIYGKILGQAEWQGSSALNKCIVAWMPIPSFDEILENNTDVLKRLKDK